MAGSIKSEYFGESSALEPRIMWELFYGNKNEWILYGTANQSLGAPTLTGSWDVTITLGTGETTTFTIYPNNSRVIVRKNHGLIMGGDAYFYCVVPFTTPSQNTKINVSVTSSVHESLGVGNFSGNYVAADPSDSFVFVQNQVITATAGSDFTWSFDVSMDVIQDDNTVLSEAGISASITHHSGYVVLLNEKNGTRKTSKSYYEEGKSKYHYEFTLESQSTSASNVQAIKDIYSYSHPESSITLISWTSILFIWSEWYDGSPRVAKNLNQPASTELNVVTPPPTVSDGWFTTAVNNSAAGGSDAFQYYIKNKSRVRASFDDSKINVSELCGATIAKYKVTMNGVTYSVTNTGKGTALNTNALTRLGDNTLTLSAVDTRGAEYELGSTTVFVHDYAEPTLSNISAYRCDSAGIQDDNGTYLYLRALASVASVDGHNAVTLKSRYKPTSGGYGDYSAMENDNPAVIGGGLVSTGSSYNVEIIATDTAGFSATYVAFIPSEIVLFSLKRGGKAVGVGMHVDAEDDYTYHVGFDTYLHRDLILGNGTRLTEEQLIRLLALIKEG